MPRGQGPAVALSTVYASPEVPPRSAPGACAKLPGPWYWALLGAGWVGTAVLTGIVLWLLQRQGGNGPVLSQDMETPASKCSWESCLVTSSRQDIPEFKCSLRCFQLQLRQRLCEPGSHNVTGTARSHSSSAAGASACWLCPAGWQPFAAKCYWVSTNTSTWKEAAENCGYQRSQLAVLESAEEKAFIGEMTRTSSGAWMGLSIDQTRGQEWSWRDGSALQAALSPVLGPVQANACAAIWGGQLRSHICSAPLHWVCQKKATEI
ncbi:killer cell lectin-like receptor subfamily F member 1 [Patagioenas fasciata]|uniref:killer cell lectin-like receptor subfamily F member 1 n=1 Tax=Patagioenas fasciata TaxID=372321 RepID=UPI003A98E968